MKEGNMKRKTNIMIWSILILSVLILFSCSFPPPQGVMNIRVSRDQYQPLLESSKFAEYRGQIIIFDSIDIDARDVTNFYYLNEDKTVGYTLFYKSDGIQQPVVSFFWYALQKTFENIGIDVRERGLIKNAAQLNLKIIALTDQEAKFIVSLLRNGYLIMQKEIIVSKKFPPTKDDSELKKRAYEFIDHIAATILSDPDIKREFFSEKGKISLDKSIPEIPQASSAPVTEVPGSSLVPTPTVPAPTTEPERDEVVNEGQKDQLEDNSLKQQSRENEKDTPSSAEKTY